MIDTLTEKVKALEEFATQNLGVTSVPPKNIATPATLSNRSY